jgi:uncharacterized protein (DUF427 family)
MNRTEHNRYHRDYKRKIRAERRTQKVCIECGGVLAARSQTLCDNHLAQCRKYQNEHNRRLREEQTAS